MMSTECVFCKIARGDIPSFTIYEDDLFKVILDRFPAAPGHALIIPKVHYKDMFELPREVSEALYPLAQKVATQIKKAVGAEGMNVVQNNGEVAGQSVYHFHLHLVPRKAGDGIILNKSSKGDTALEELEMILKQIQEVK